MRVPHSCTESNETNGRAIYQLERVEVGVTLAPDTFALRATSAALASVPKPVAVSSGGR
jgi:hypothetical protein